MGLFKIKISFKNLKVQFTFYHVPSSPFTLLPLSLFVSVHDNFIPPATQTNNLGVVCSSNTVHQSLFMNSVGSTLKYIHNLCTCHHSFHHQLQWKPSQLLRDSEQYAPCWPVVPPYSLFSTGQPEHLAKTEVRQFISLIFSKPCRLFIYYQQSQRPCIRS